jgi:ATP-dependent Lhr-like helicase
MAAMQDNAASPGPNPYAQLSAVAQDLHRALHERGASFFADLVRMTKHLPAEVEAGLWELVAAGLVTADGFDNLRALMDPRRRRAEGRERSRRPRHSAGRWSLLRHESASMVNRHSSFEVDSAFSTEQSVLSESAQHSDFGELSRAALDAQHYLAEQVARQLLRRYGVVFRDLLARESLALPWRNLLTQYRRMELKGEIRGGRFVSGFTGEQFALPEAIESVRAMRRADGKAGERPSQDIRISGADPLNLVGVILPGARVPAIWSNYVVFRGGVPIRTGTVRDSSSPDDRPLNFAERKAGR